MLPHWCSDLQLKIFFTAADEVGNDAKQIDKNNKISLKIQSLTSQHTVSPSMWEKSLGRSSSTLQSLQTLIISVNFSCTESYNLPCLLCTALCLSFMHCNGSFLCLLLLLY